MINYAPMPQDQYCFHLDFKSQAMKDMILGIGDRKHVDDPALWNLLVITSKLPYLWEDPKVTKGDKPANFVTLAAAKEDMGAFIGSNVIRDMVKTMTPLEFLEEARSHSLYHLKLCKFFGGDEGGLRSIITARAYTWALANGIEIPTNGKAIIKMIWRIEK